MGRATSNAPGAPLLAAARRLPHKVSDDVAIMEVLSLVNYYARCGYYRHVQTVCGEVLKKRPNDPLVLFWKAFGMVKEGSSSEAVREIEGLLRQ